LQRQIIVGHSNPVRVATKPVLARYLLKNSLEGPEGIKLSINEFAHYLRPYIIVKKINWRLLLFLLLST
jgi:hypothetical protein